MKKLVAICVAMLSTLAFAGDPAPKAEPMKAEPGKTQQWMPRKVTKEDKKGIEAVYAAAEKAMMAGNVEEMASYCDFPLYMVTDNSAGVPMDETWNREMYLKTMKDTMANMPKEMKVTHKYKPMFLTDSLAMVEETHTSMMGKQKMEWKSASLMVNRNGKWMYKSMVEGGWGDMMPPAKAEAMPAPAAAPGTKTAAMPAATPTPAPAPAPVKK